MTFISSSEVDESLRKHGMIATLQAHGRKRVAPGFIVADYVKIGNFFTNAFSPHRDDLAHWDSITHPNGKPALA
jgi:hypothetical protein